MLFFILNLPSLKCKNDGYYFFQQSYSYFFSFKKGEYYGFFKAIWGVILTKLLLSQKSKKTIIKNKVLFTLFILLSLSSLSIANPTLTLKSVGEIAFQINHDYVYPVDNCGKILTVTVQCAPNSACSVEGNMQQAADDYKAAHTGPDGCYF